MFFFKFKTNYIWCLIAAKIDDFSLPPNYDHLSNTSSHRFRFTEYHFSWFIFAWANSISLAFHFVQLIRLCNDFCAIMNAHRAGNVIKSIHTAATMHKKGVCNWLQINGWNVWTNPLKTEREKFRNEKSPFHLIYGFLHAVVNSSEFLKQLLSIAQTHAHTLSQSLKVINYVKSNYQQNWVRRNFIKTKESKHTSDRQMVYDTCLSLVLPDRSYHQPHHKL